jgi:hypothetical protein
MLISLHILIIHLKKKLLQYFIFQLFLSNFLFRGPLMVAQWLRYCATNRKVADSIPDGVIGFLH